VAYGIEAHQIERLPVPSNLYLALATPHVEVPTAMARACLPTEIPLRTMVRQTAAIARLIHAIYTDDLESMAAAMEGDSVIEPARAHLMPLLREARSVAKEAGALGLVISGAGPTLCAVCADPETAARVTGAMGDLYTNAGIGCTTRSASVAEHGATVCQQVAGL
jgi:homoserine kinase